MKELLLTLLIFGTAYAQLTEQDLRELLGRRRLRQSSPLHGGFVASGLPVRRRVPSWNMFPRRTRFRSNVDITGPSPRPSIPTGRNYLQSLRSTLVAEPLPIRMRQPLEDSRFSFDPQTARRRYLPAIKRPRYTPRMSDILPRREPSYSPTARGVDGAPRLPSTVSGLGLFNPGSVNELLEMTDPVTDRSYSSTRKGVVAPSRLDRPVDPLEPQPFDPMNFPELPQNEILTVSGSINGAKYVGPKLPVAPIFPIEPLPLPQIPIADPSYVSPELPIDQILPIEPHGFPPKSINDPSYDGTNLPIDPIFPIEPPGFPPKSINDPSYDGTNLPIDPILPIESLGFPPKSINDPSYDGTNLPIDPILPIEPLGFPPKSINDPSYDGTNLPIDPILPIEPPGFPPKSISDPSYDGTNLPIDPILPIEPLGFPPKSINDPSYDGTNLPIDPILPIEPPGFPPKSINDPSYDGTNLPIDPILPIEPLGFPPKSINDPSYDGTNLPIDPILPIEPLGFPPKSINDPSYDGTNLPIDPILPIEPHGFPPKSINDPSYVGPNNQPSSPSFPPFDPFDELSSPFRVNNPVVKGKREKYVSESVSTLTDGPLDGPLHSLLEPSSHSNLASLPQMMDSPHDALPSLKSSDPNYISPNIQLFLDAAQSGGLDGLLSPDAPFVHPVLPGALPLTKSNTISPLPFDPLDILNPSGPDTGPLSQLPDYVPPVSEVGRLNVPDPQDPLGPTGPLFDSPFSLVPPSSQAPDYVPPIGNAGTMDFPDLLGPNIGPFVDPLPRGGLDGPLPQSSDYVPPTGDAGPMDLPDLLGPNMGPFVDPLPRGGLDGPLPQSSDYVPPTGDAGPMDLPDLFGPNIGPFVDPLPRGGLDGPLPQSSDYVAPTGDAGPMDLPDILGPNMGPFVDPLPRGGLDGPLPQSSDYVPPTGNAGPMDLPDLLGPNIGPFVDPLPRGGLDGPLPQSSDYVPPIGNAGPMDFADLLGPNIGPFVDPLPSGGLDGPLPQSSDYVPPVNGVLPTPDQHDGPILPWSPLQPIDPTLPGPLPSGGEMLFPGELGLADPVANPGPYDQEPALPLNPIFDGVLPPDPVLASQIERIDSELGLIPTRQEINEAARREYAKSEDAFNPKWNNPKVRNDRNRLYVPPREVAPANVDALFDPSSTGLTDVMDKAVGKVSQNTKDKLNKKTGYLTKYDALRSYQG